MSSDMSTNVITIKNLSAFDLQKQQRQPHEQHEQQRQQQQQQQQQREQQLSRIGQYQPLKSRSPAGFIPAITTCINPNVADPGCPGHQGLGRSMGLGLGNGLVCTTSLPSGGSCSGGGGSGEPESNASGTSASSGTASATTMATTVSPLAPGGLTSSTTSYSHQAPLRPPPPPPPPSVLAPPPPSSLYTPVSMGFFASPTSNGSPQPLSNRLVDTDSTSPGPMNTGSIYSQASLCQSGKPLSCAIAQLPLPNCPGGGDNGPGAVGYMNGPPRSLLSHGPLPPLPPSVPGATGLLAYEMALPTAANLRSPQLSTPPPPPVSSLLPPQQPPPPPPPNPPASALSLEAVYPSLAYATPPPTSPVSSMSPSGLHLMGPNSPARFEARMLCTAYVPSLPPPPPPLSSPLTVGYHSAGGAGLHQQQQNIITSMLAQQQQYQQQQQQAHHAGLLGM
ncbi:unnamed protein product [Protopolystoma xenopodis]|uniref:Uncharacterized protein n=1 Tax=Protopolystoma xenopodis TaxID=117903 RepID=A0A3S5BEF1_9PLAT|nr:unnamed protein product [Protopolystoma xenopodis]